MSMHSNNSRMPSLKHLLLRILTLTCKPTEISVGASSVGLGAILAQSDPVTGNKHVVAYASRSLTPVEQHYSQTEREALAVVWGCEYYRNIYIYGKPVTVNTDHKPLIAYSTTIFSPSH